MQNIRTYPLINHFAWHPIRRNVAPWSISCVLLLHGFVLWAALGASQDEKGFLKKFTPPRVSLIPQSDPPRTELALTRPETRTSDHLGLTESSVSSDAHASDAHSSVEASPSPSESTLPTKSLFPKVRSSPPAPVPPNRRSPQKLSTSPSYASAPVASSQPAKSDGVQTVTPSLASPSSSYHCPTPEYPTLSRRLKEEGVVTLRFLLGMGGQILKTEIAQTSGFSRLDHAAISALSRCQFHPIAERHPAQPRWAIIDYLWKLKR